MLASLLSQVFELRVSIRVLFFCIELFGIAPQLIVFFSQKSANHRQTDLIAFLLQAPRDIRQSTVQPLSRTHWITARVFPDAIEQDPL